MELSKVIEILSNVISRKGSFKDEKGKLVFLKEITEDSHYPVYKKFEYKILYVNIENPKDTINICQIKFEANIPSNQFYEDTKYKINEKLEQSLLDALLTLFQDTDYINENLKGVVFK